MNTGRTLILYLALVLAGAHMLSAQTPQITGVPNKYVRVLFTKDCNDTIIVGDITGMGLASGNRALIIQMKGGETQSVRKDCCPEEQGPGSVEHYNAAGNFEFVTIETVEAMSPLGGQARNRVILQNPLKNLYEAGLWWGHTNGVQLVKIPHDGMGDLYNDLKIGVAGVNVPVWNTSTPLCGGVFALEITGTLTITGDIDVRNTGFIGGDVSAVGTDTSYRGRFSASDSWYGDQLSGEKGEGIDSLVAFFNAGRGWIANGGGGGNADGGGGGGGGNFGVGGAGGRQASTLDQDILTGGEGGQAMDYAGLGARVFMGGGGGGGHSGHYSMIPPSCAGCANPCTSCVATSGGRGGGIVIIRAAKIIVDGGNIRASGERASNADNAGGGGGGAGGAVFLAVPAFSQNGMSTMAINVNGGDGGDARQVETAFLTPPPACFGPGGGGGGGIIRYSHSLPGFVTVITAGGNAGVTTITGVTSACTASARGAAAGANGSSSAGLVLPGDPLP